MQVTVNGRSVVLFAGATVRDALRKACPDEWRRVRRGLMTVRDAHGHEVGLDGELSGGESLATVAHPPEEPRP